MFEQQWPLQQIVTTMAIRCFAYGSSAILRTFKARRGDAVNDAANPPFDLAEPLQRLTVERRNGARFFLDGNEIIAELRHLACAAGMFLLAMNSGKR
jgi:hypothetical protein